MSTSPVYGWQSQLGVGNDSTTLTRLDFQSSTLGLDEEFKDASGLRGTRSRLSQRVVQGIRHCGGAIRMQPTPVELAAILQWIMGGAPSGVGNVTYPLADTLGTQYVMIDKVAKVMSYAVAGVNRFSIKGSQGEPLDVELEVVALDEAAGSAGTFPALSLDTTTTPFTFQECAVTINSVTYFARDFSLTVDNAIDRNRFFNSSTLTAIAPMDRHVAISFTLPAKDAIAVYGVGVAGLPVTVTVTGTGTAVLTLTLHVVTFPRKPINVDPNEIFLPCPGISYYDGANREVVAVLHV